MYNYAQCLPLLWHIVWKHNYIAMSRNIYVTSELYESVYKSQELMNFTFDGGGGIFSEAQLLDGRIMPSSVQVTQWKQRIQFIINVGMIE